MPVFQDLTDQRFARLTAKYVVTRKPRTLWFCLCSCGKTTVVDASHLKNGHTKSCGCLKIEVSTKRCTTHGMKGTSGYLSWGSMLNRCNNPNNKNYKDYGGRGITVCPEWQHSYPTFIADMGFKPKGDYSIDRVDNSKGYAPDNCRWVTRAEQAQNTRKSRPFYATSPIGRRYRATCQAVFIRQHNLGRAGISSVLKGEQTHHKDWFFQLV